MASLNKVLLMGNLTRYPEVRHTPKGTAVGDLAMAINMTYKAQDEEAPYLVAVKKILVDRRDVLNTLREVRAAASWP